MTAGNGAGPVWPERPYPPLDGSQVSFVNSTAFECLYHGTRGPGKTTGLILDFLQDVCKGHGAAWRGVLFRRSYPELEDVRVKTREWLAKLELGARWSMRGHKWVFADGAELLLRFMARPEDYWAYHGHEFPWIGWEELTTWPTAECYEAMLACCRSSHPGVERRVRATCNPYGPGHAWVKARFIDAAPRGWLAEADGGRTRAHIFGALIENRILLAADPDYRKTLAADSNPNRRKAWLEGRWDIVAGGLFDDLWDPRVHVVAPFEVPEGWRIDRAFDWGSSSPFSVGWWAESDGGDLVLADGTRRATLRGDLYRIFEWYGWSGRPNEGCRLAIGAIAAGILERERGLGLTGRVRAGPADSQIYDASRGRSLAEDMAAAGVRWTRAAKGPGSRRTGAEQLRALLAGARPGEAGARERPGLFIFETCRHFIRTVPVLPRDARDPDDADTEAEDHVYDETRYRVTARKGLGGEKKVKGFW